MKSGTLVASVVLSLGSWAAIAQSRDAKPAAARACAYDRAAMLALDWKAFDQDPEGGWRTLEDREGCEAAAADLLRDYRQSHPSADSIILWHEG